MNDGLPIPDFYKKGIKIRMLVSVRPDGFGGKPGTVLKFDREYDAVANPHAAISGFCENGELLGVRPGEFEFVSAPEWVLRKWVRFDDASGDSALKILKGGI